MILIKLRIYLWKLALITDMAFFNWQSETIEALKSYVLHNLFIFPNFLLYSGGL